MRSRNSLVLLFLAPLLLRALVVTAAPLGRSFTYQGQLSQSGVPVDGTVTLRFSLWDAAGTGDPPTGGTQVGNVQTLTNVPVSAGVFSVALNGGDEFGAQAFNGEARWLQVAVCADSTCGATTVLGPRQALTGAPYALGPWQATGTSLNYMGGWVGIGTNTPAHAFHIKDTAPAVVLEDVASASQQSGYVSFRNSVQETGWMGYGSAGSPDMTLANARPNGDIAFWAGTERMRVEAGGNVGIGTSVPASKLEVRGDIRVGPLGEYFTPGSSENLRIVRGKVNAAGNVVFGSGFTAVRASTGVYNITFSPAFPSGQWPIVTASAESNGTVARFAMVNTPTHISAPIRIVNGSGTAADDDFYFIAVGPR
jgi:hypothetical protein